MTAHHAGHIQAVIRTCHVIAPSLRAVIQHDIEAARQGHDKLLLFFESVAVAMLVTRHIVQPVSTRYLERNMPCTLDERQVSPLVCHFGQLDPSHPVKAHRSPVLSNIVHTGFSSSARRVRANVPCLSTPCDKRFLPKRPLSVLVGVRWSR